MYTCALASWLVWANGQEGKQANARECLFCMCVVFFDVILVYTITFRVFFFVREELFDLVAMIESEFVLRFFFVLCLLILVLVEFGSSS